MCKYISWTISLNCLPGCSSSFLLSTYPLFDQKVKVFHFLDCHGMSWRTVKLLVVSPKDYKILQVLAAIDSWCWCGGINVRTWSAAFWTHWAKSIKQWFLSGLNSCIFNKLRVIWRYSLVCSSVRVLYLGMRSFGSFLFLRKFDSCAKQFVIRFQGGMMSGIDILSSIFPPYV